VPHLEKNPTVDVMRPAVGALAKVKLAINNYMAKFVEIARVYLAYSHITFTLYGGVAQW